MCPYNEIIKNIHENYITLTIYFWIEKKGVRHGRIHRDFKVLFSFLWLRCMACRILNKNLFKSGEGNGTPLQYSCLENPMDGGAWWAAVHGVAEGQTRLSDFTFTFHFHALEKERQPTPVFLPGESQGQGSLVGCRLWGRTELDTTEVT